MWTLIRTGLFSGRKFKKTNIGARYRSDAELILSIWHLGFNSQHETTKPPHKYEQSSGHLLNIILKVYTQK
jgi:hypothetical protein